MKEPECASFRAYIKPIFAPGDFAKPKKSVPNVVYEFSICYAKYVHFIYTHTHVLCEQALSAEGS